MELTRETVIRLAKEAGAGVALTMSSSPQVAAAEFRGRSLERFAHLVIADFLARTGQYVTNDASREAALAQARAEEREAILRTAPGDWGAAYDTFKTGKALPNDAPALQYAFAAGMLFERAAILALIKAGLDREREAEADKAARAARGTDDELQLMRHWLDVRLWNSAHEKLLVAVKARIQP